MSFHDTRLDDEQVLLRSDTLLRHLAEGGARVRREALAAAEALESVSDRHADTPRAVVAAGPDSRLLRAVLEPVCPVPFVAWSHPGLPAWVGSLDLVVVLAPDGSDAIAAGAAAEAARRGAQVVVATPADSLVADHAASRWSTVLPCATGDPLAVAVSVLVLLDRLRLGPPTAPEVVAATLDEVAVACAPARDLSTNPAKILAIGIAEDTPLLWGGTVLAARAARRISESLRRASGRTAIAADAEHLLPVLEAAERRDVFADPFADGGTDARPVLIVLDDGADDPRIAQTRDRLQETARARDIRVHTIESQAEGDVARYAAMLLTGTYAATYLQIGSL